MTLDPNMFTPQAAVGHAVLPADAGNGFFGPVCTLLGATTDAAVSPAVTTQTALHHISVAIPDAATATYTYVVADACEVVDVIVRKSGAGAGNTIQVFNGTPTAISDAIAAAVDKAVTRAGTIDPATATLAAGASLKITATRAAGSMLANVTIVVRRR